MSLTPLELALGAVLEPFRSAIETELRRREREADMLRLNAAPDPDDDDDEDIPEPAGPAGEPGDAAVVALRRAREAWSLGIEDPWGRRDYAELPHASAFIDRCIRGPAGLGWPSCEYGKEARSGVPYIEARAKFQWCGAFAAWAFGPCLRAVVRRKHFSSTSRLYAWSAGTPRRVPLADVRPGDVVVVGPAGDIDGAHVTLCEGVVLDNAGRAMAVHTVEGNAHGEGPGGVRIRGVVRQVRVMPNPTLDSRTYRVAFVVRPPAEDLA